ncbi:MAG: DinB family protein [Thermoplasmata archaeon]
MDELGAIRRWYDYLADTRMGYLAALQGLSVEQQKFDPGASFPIRDIFLHILDAYRWWFRYAYADRLHEFVPRRAELRLRARIRDLEEARREADVTDREVRGIVDALVPLDLDRVLQFASPTDEDPSRWEPRRVTIREMLWHMVEEELQHRGELNALLWQLGVEPPIVEWIDWAQRSSEDRSAAGGAGEAGVPRAGA